MILSAPLSYRSIAWPGHSCPLPKGKQTFPGQSVSLHCPAQAAFKATGFVFHRMGPERQDTSIVYSVWRESAFARRPLAVEPELWK
jgi:hypothetical protein